jgi:hypothetical protein
MKILCSGNPNDHTIASGIRELYPDADFASRTTGFDLRFWDDVYTKDEFKNQVINYDVFINSSFICGWGQHQLLELTVESWRESKHPGHIVNIGSTVEWDGVNSPYGVYVSQKRALQERSLQLNMKNSIRTTHVIVGGINDGKAGHEDWIKPVEIARTIQWVIEKIGPTVPLIALV